MTDLEATAEAEDDLRRIATLEARNPDVMIWPPDGSVSGDWEALGDGWLIQEESPVRFREQLEARANRGCGMQPATGATT